MNSGKIIKRGIEVIVLLFAAFNGFFTNWAPPTQQFSKFSFEVGLISFVALAILLFIESQSRKIWATGSYWYIIVIPLILGGIFTGLIYKSNLSNYVIEFPSQSSSYYIIGDTYTPNAEEYLKDYPNKTTEDLIKDFEGIGNIEKVWTRASINSVQIKLSIYYVIFVLLIVTSIFVLAESKFFRK